MITVAGESLVDLVPEGDGRLRVHPGGAPFNVAVGLGRLGSATTLISPVSEDPLGKLLARRLADSGVALRPTERTGRPTTLALVDLDAAGHASYTFYLDGTSATEMTSDELALAASEDHGAAGVPLHVSLGAVTLANSSTGSALAALLSDRHAHGFTSLDPNVRPAVIADMEAERDALSSAMRAVDLVKVSDADLHALEPEHDPLEVAGRWARSGPALVVVTRGAEGATAIREDGGTLTVASLPVDVVDTVGAGDAFTAGLLAALEERGLLERAALRSASATVLREALLFAAGVAAVTCTRQGADPPRRDELPTER